MRQPGRPSRASLSVVEPVLDRYGRPNPPAILTEPEAAQWQTYVKRMPPDWFPAESWPVLIELCQSIELSKRLAQEIRRIKSLRDPANLDRFLKLTRQKLEISGLIATHSTKLRFTNQSRLKSERAFRDEQLSRYKKPWEILGDDPADNDSEAMENAACECSARVRSHYEQLFS